MFYFNDERGIVVHKLEGFGGCYDGDFLKPNEEEAFDYFFNKIRKRLSSMKGIDGSAAEKIAFYLVGLIVDKGMIKDAYVGKAKCNFADGDTYDEDRGMQLAEARSRIRYWEDIMRAGEFLSEIIYTVQDVLEERIDTAWEIVDKKEEDAYLAASNKANI